MKFLIYLLISSFLSLTTAFGIEISDLKTKEYSLLNAYLELMESKKLIHQTDIRLKKRSLLKKNGGLCAFTGMVNAIQATSQYYQIYTSKFLKNPDYFLYQVIDEARAYMEEDPTYDGINFWYLVYYTNIILQGYDLDQIIRTTHAADTYINVNMFREEYWKLRLLGLTGEKNEGHTIVLLKVDKEKQVFYTSDPNYPNKIVVTPYKQKGRKLYVVLSQDFPGFQNALVDEVINITVRTD